MRACVRACGEIVVGEGKGRGRGIVRERAGHSLYEHGGRSGLEGRGCNGTPSGVKA